MRLILNNSPVARALKTYDPNIRVRWSWEKKKWAVEARAKRGKMILPPVFYKQVQDGKDWFEESLLPERSERYIQYHDQSYVICWTKDLSWGMYEKIISMDTHRARTKEDAIEQSMQGFLSDQKNKDKAKTDRQAEVARVAYEKYHWLNNKKPWNDPIGACA